MAKIKEHWVKTTPYGDYNETPDRKSSGKLMIFRQAIKLGIVGKHVGSKPLKRLLKGLARVNEDTQNLKKIEKAKS